MTRSQALNVITGSLYFGFDKASAEKWLGIFEGLGMIAIEEEKTSVQRLCVELGWPIGSRSETELRCALISAGLKLVEVQS